MRLLAEIVRSGGPNAGNSAFPYVLPNFGRLIEQPGILFSNPDEASFARAEQKIAERIRALAADATEAHKSRNAAQAWFDDLQKQLATASPDEKDRLTRQADQKKDELERWLSLEREKIAAVNDEYARLDALLRHDYVLVAKLRSQSEATSEAPPSSPPNASLPLTASQNQVAAAERDVPQRIIGVGASSLAVGLNKYFALLIANDDYLRMQKLKTPVHDAQSLAEVLRTKYGFDVTVLLNATRAQLIGALYRLRSLPKDTDNVLVFYAGHGYFDEVSNTGYWIPTDADSDSPANWVSNADITTQLRAVAAKRVLVIADSCYSGTLTRESVVRTPDADYLKKIAGRRARLVITSGGNEPVVDAGVNGHSVFANAFLGTLTENEGLIETTSLFEIVRRRVLDSAMSKQVPLLSTIRDAEHDGGEFFFFPHSPTAQ